MHGLHILHDLFQGTAGFDTFTIDKCRQAHSIAFGQGGRPVNNSDTVGGTRTAGRVRLRALKRRI